MSQAFAAGSSSDHHIAQQSRRDKLRVQQQHQFVDGCSNPNPNQIVNNINNQEATIYSCATNMNILTNPSAIYDLAVPVGHGHGHNWIAIGSRIRSTGHPFLFSHLYHMPASAEMISAQEMVTPSTPTSSGLDIASLLAPWQQHQMEVDAGFAHGAVASATQGLSLSLASKPHAELHVAGHSQFNCSNPPQAKLLVDPRRAVGPLGPFIGYATVLKSSKFARPAQQLLDGFCSAVTGSKFARQAQCDHNLAVHERRNSVGGSVGDYGGDGSSSSVRGWNSGVSSSSSFYSSTEGGNGSEGGAGGGANCSIQQQPETRQKKVKLLYLQEEVCRRYKQYHQQMQMVVSSFESVAGLSAATPYTSLALKIISKHFRSIKHSISNQLRHVCRALGEDFMSSPSSSSSSSSRGETMTTPRLKYIDQNLRKQKASENTSLGFSDNNQPVWRPQRGLPERAVSVLRAWLFEHFLHPYPTDTDKHMLATQTGLTRNQHSLKERWCTLCNPKITNGSKHAPIFRPGECN